MTKYLFLLGFFAFSFLSTPAANAVQVTVYQGVVYESEDLKILACDRRGRDVLRGMRANGEIVNGQNAPAGCDREGISKFILFEELEKAYSVDGYKYVKSFAYYSNTKEWLGGKYIEVRDIVFIEECKEGIPGDLLEDCLKNVAQFRILESATNNVYYRAPDSIKQEKVVE